MLFCGGGGGGWAKKNLSANFPFCSPPSSYSMTGPYHKIPGKYKEDEINPGLPLQCVKKSQVPLAWQMALYDVLMSSLMT